jgi:hypothetical protein
MSELFAYSECLDFLTARKMLASLQKPGGTGKWSDWSGAGGSDIEIKRKGVLASALAELEVPDFCSSFHILASDRLLPCTRIPHELMIGGNSFELPEYGDSAGICVDVVLHELNYPVRIGFGKNSGMRHYHRPYNQSSRLSLIFPKEAYQMEGLVYGEFPDKVLARNAVEDLRKKFRLPDKSCSGLLESRDRMDEEMGEFLFTFELSRFGQLKEIYTDLFAHLLATSPCDRYQFLSSVDFGGAAKFEGEVHNVSPVIRKLLPLIRDCNDFPAFDLTYCALGPRSWKDREKARKKWKKPVVEQLGTATLETGAVAKVRVVTEKEGYVFYLDFESDDDLIKFYHSKLFKKTKWHSGAE